MLSVKITRELYNDLILINTLQSEETVKEFCRMSSQLILNQTERKRDTFLSKKLLEKAASKLKIEDPLKIDRCIAAIGHIFVEASKFGYTSGTLCEIRHKTYTPNTMILLNFYLRLT